MYDSKQVTGNRESKRNLSDLWIFSIMIQNYSLLIFYWSDLMFLINSTYVFVCLFHRLHYFLTEGNNAIFYEWVIIFVLIWVIIFISVSVIIPFYICCFCFVFIIVGSYSSFHSLFLISGCNYSILGGGVVVIILFSGVIILFFF